MTRLGVASLLIVAFVGALCAAQGAGAKLVTFRVTLNQMPVKSNIIIWDHVYNTFVMSTSTGDNGIAEVSLPYGSYRYEVRQGDLKKEGSFDFLEQSVEGLMVPVELGSTTKKGVIVIPLGWIIAGVAAVVFGIILFKLLRH